MKRMKQGRVNPKEMETEEAGFAADTGSIDVMGGEIEIEANVNVDFSIQ